MEKNILSNRKENVNVLKQLAPPHSAYGLRVSEPSCVGKNLKQGSQASMKFYDGICRLENTKKRRNFLFLVLKK